MSASELPTDFFIRLSEGSDSVAEEINRRYRRRLCALVEREMGKRFAAREDPEDPVQSALRSFFSGIEVNRFQVDQESKLWGLLATIAQHKALKHIERNTTAGRDPAAESPAGDEPLAGREPRPEDAVVTADLLEHVLDGLEPPTPEIVRLRLQGHTRAEIARLVDLTEANVRMKLDRVRDRLRRHLDRSARFEDI